MKGLSGKEIEMVSFLEMNEKFFFTREDVKRFFSSGNEMNVYIHNLKKKGRIIRINRSKYYLIPVRAFKGRWSEHPFIVIDEMFNGKDYFISGMAAAYYWGLIEQIPTMIEVRSTKNMTSRKIFSFAAVIKRTKSLDAKKFVRREIKGHGFFIEAKREVERWLKSR